MEPFNFVGKWQTVGDYEKTKVGKQGKVYEISKTSNGLKIKITDDSLATGIFWDIEDFYNVTDIQTKNSFTLLGWKEGVRAAEKCKAKCPEGHVNLYKTLFRIGAAKIYKLCRDEDPSKGMNETRHWHAFVRLSEIEKVDEDIGDH